jgi:hypothetical protein
MDMPRWLKLGSLSALLLGMCWQYAVVCIDPGRFLSPYHYTETWYEYYEPVYYYEPYCCGWLDYWWFP